MDHATGKMMWAAALRGVIVATVVGPLLTLINQFDGIFGNAPFYWGRFALTMCVPFCVSTVSSILTGRLALDRLLKERETHEGAVNTLLAENDVLLRAVEANKKHAESGVQDRDQQRRVAALEAVRTIRGNACKVNESSVERVQFISNLISRFEEVNVKISQLQQDAVRTGDASYIVQEGADEIAKSVTGMIDDAEQLSQTVSGFPVLRATFETHFDAVREATSVVSELASQIRLLALNASVEAANVGDAGRGFAVIALEVRELADRAGRDVGQISGVLTALDDVQQDLVTQIQSIEERIVLSRKRADSCSKTTVVSGQHIEQLNDEMRRFSADITAQLPQIVSLIEGVQQIKQNTEAAVDGSARNITLCDAVLSQLGEAAALAATRTAA